MNEALYIIDSYPSEANLNKIKNFLPFNNGSTVNIFFVDYGVFWLLDPFWATVYSAHFVYYVHAHDADKYSIPFKDEVVFSGMPALEQLLLTTENVHRLNED